MTRTDEISAEAFVWKQGLNDWVKLNYCQEISPFLSNGKAEVKESFDRMQIESNPNAKNYYQDAEGKFHIFDFNKKVWKTQESVTL